MVNRNPSIKSIFRAREDSQAGGYYVKILGASILSLLLIVGVFGTLSSESSGNDTSSPQRKQQSATSSSSSTDAKISSPSTFQKYFGSEPDPLEVDMEIPTKIALFVTYPNSGTSYTLENVRAITGLDTGTNYLAAGVEHAEELTPSGPYFRYSGQPQGHGLAKVSGSQFLLTKSHCLGRCMMCPPKKVLDETKSLMEFRKGCLMTRPNYVHFPESIVQRGVHIIRHPIDNLVARVNFEFRTVQKDKAVYQDDPFWTDPNVSKRDRVIKHCKLQDDLFGQELVDRQKDPAIALHILQHMPLCAYEIFKYIKWHENVFLMFHALKIERDNFPTYHFFYEDYSTKYNQTVTELLDFLNVPSKGWEFAAPFIPNKTYVDIFTKEEQEQIYRYIQKLASPMLWDLLNDRYGFFPEERSTTSGSSQPFTSFV